MRRVKSRIILAHSLVKMVDGCVSYSVGDGGKLGGIAETQCLFPDSIAARSFCFVVCVADS